MALLRATVRSGILAGLCIICCLAQVHALAQNKVITRDFPWQIRSTLHFDVYYYGEPGTNLLPYASQYLESAYLRSTSVLPAALKDRLPFFLYNNHNEYEETNVTDIGEGTGGVTEAFKNRFLVAHIGSQRYLEYVIAHEFTHEIEYEYLFTGFWRSVRLLKFIFYPAWLMEGLSEYTSDDLDSTVREMYIRDAATSHRLLPLEQLQSFNHVMPHQVTLAYKESGLLMDYLAQEYGVDKLAQILNLYSDRFDPNTVLLEIIGTDLFGLDRKFREFLEDKYRFQVEDLGLQEPDAYGPRITERGPYPRFYECPVFAPDGGSIYYISDETGYLALYRRGLSGGKPKKLWGVNKDDRRGVENIHTEGTGLSLNADGSSLVFAGEREQQDYLYLFDTRNGRISEVATRTETVASPKFAPDGRTVYFSGMRGGFRDLYSFDIKDGRLTQLTTGPMDDIDAVPSPDGKFLVFAEERENRDGRIEYDLCRLDLATLEKNFITSLTGDERYPRFSPDGTSLYFTSDQDGIADLYCLFPADNRIERLTRVVGGNFQPAVSPDGSRLVFSSFRRNDMHLYLADVSTFTALASPEPEPVHSRIRTSAFSEQIFAGASRPYRFRASTDLFFPAIFYSSLDGLSLALLWQGSDFLGDNQVQAATSYSSAIEYIDYQVTYAFLKFRPRFYFNFVGQEYFADIEMTDKHKEYLQSMTVSYPLNRFQDVALTLGTIDRREYISTPPPTSNRTRENIAGIAFTHDTTLAPYLETTSGWYGQVSAQFSDRVLSGDYQYQNYIAGIGDFFPLGKENVLAVKGIAGASYGPHAGTFRLGGETGVRGLPSDDTFSGRRVFLSSFEWRMPLVYNINYHLWYIFPDFFFKTLYGTLFIDAGAAWDTEQQFAHLTSDYWKASYPSSNSPT